jgi:glycosyltransferase involved in cell wall biosynthesis
MPICPVSVIIPAFNAERWLERAVRSCLTQSLRPAEILIVDDASQDGTYRLAENLATQFSEIRLFRLDANRGPAAARNLGVRESRCEFVSFLDADDYWAENKLAHQMAMMDARPNLGLIFTALRDEDETGRRLRELRFHFPETPEGRVVAAFLFRLKQFTPTLLLRKVVFVKAGGLDESLRYCEDVDLFMKIVPTCEVAYLDEPLVHRCVHAASTSHAGAPLAIEPHYLRFMQMALQRFPYLRPHAKDFAAKLDWQLGRRFQKQADNRNARRYLWRSFRTRPALRTGLAIMLTFWPAHGKMASPFASILKKSYATFRL